MAFKASNIVPASAYNTVKHMAVRLKADCQSFVATLQAGNADYDLLRNIYLNLKLAKAKFDSLKATPGIAAYAQSQESDGAYDVAAEFNSMIAAIDAATGWMDANVPTNVTAKTPADWSHSASMISNNFTPSATAPLRTALNAVVAEII